MKWCNIIDCGYKNERESRMMSHYSKKHKGYPYKPLSKPYPNYEPLPNEWQPESHDINKYSEGEKIYKAMIPEYDAMRGLLK